MHDAIVVGAGLNGLATAAYLAKAGRKVLVLERRAVIGGSAVTEEIHPGYRVDVCSHDAGWLPPVIVEELSLESHGLTMLQPEATVFSPACDGPPLTLWRDPRRTADALRSRSSSDAQRFGAFGDQMGRLAGFLASVYESPAPRLTSTKPAELFALARLARRLRALGKRDMIEFLRVLPMSAAELLDDWFESDTLKGAIGGAAISGVCHGPRSAGTAFVLLHGHVGNAGRAIRARSQPKGGIGALAAALAGVARQYGAEIRTDAKVDRVVVNKGRATGVVVRGEEIAAPVVACSADPRQTLLELTGPSHLEPEFVRAAQQIRYRGVAAKVNLALGELPRFSGITDDQALRGLISVSPSLDYLEKAYDDAKHGGVSRNPYLEVTIPSLLDESLAPAGRHVMSIKMQYAPYALRDGAWTDDRRAALGELIIDTLAEYAPNLPSTILQQQVLTPEDMECVYGAPEGNVDHGEMALDQILFMRPVAGWARHATPIDGLYLCGSGTHPGGRIVGGAGRLAAREILRAGSKKRATA